MGFDLNRHWQEPSPWAHPTLHATKQLLMQYDRDPVRASVSMWVCLQSSPIYHTFTSYSCLCRISTLISILTFMPTQL